MPVRLKPIEAAYAEVRAGEDALDLEELAPVSALQRLTEFTFDFYRDNPNYVRLVQVENIHEGKHLKRSRCIEGLNLSAIDKLRDICRKGVGEGVFKSDVSPVQLHWLITSSAVFNISNRATFEHLYGGDVFTTEGQAALKALIVEAVLGAVNL